MHKIVVKTLIYNPRSCFSEACLEQSAQLRVYTEIYSEIKTVIYKYIAQCSLF